MCQLHIIKIYALPSHLDASIINKRQNKMIKVFCIDFEVMKILKWQMSEIHMNNNLSEWFPNTISSAHVVMQYNMAVAKAIRGQLDQAAALLKQIWQARSANCRVPAHVIMLVLYIELQLGKFLICMVPYIYFLIFLSL